MRLGSSVPYLVAGSRGFLRLLGSFGVSSEVVSLDPPCRVSRRALQGRDWLRFSKKIANPARGILRQLGLVFPSRSLCSSRARLAVAWIGKRQSSHGLRIPSDSPSVTSLARGTGTVVGAGMTEAAAAVAAGGPRKPRQKHASRECKAPCCRILKLTRLWEESHASREM
jgi:hypothetical protein